MRRINSLFLSIILLFTLVGCFSTSNSSSSSKKEEYEILGDPFRLSAIVDSTNDQGVATYAVYAPYTDTFALSCTKSSRIVIYDEEKIIKEAEKEMEVDLIKDKLYGIRIETPTKINFKLQCKALNNLVTIHYDVGQAVDTTTFDTSSNSNDPLVSANVEYVKRSGGTYIYSNNPELIPYDAVGKAFIQNRGLTGDVFFTFEHANYSGVPIYLGYQLKNEGNSDVYVTVTNI